ncbi:MAG: phosphotransferase [Natronohydrobacter sp.]|nr:phosphotransferase [Natronohydrobacter sp.]
MSAPQILTPDMIGSRVPQWAGCDLKFEPLCPDVVSPVHRGVESLIWKVVPNGHAPAVLKALRPDMLKLFDTGAAIAGAELASRLGIGPRVLWSDAAHGALAMEYLGDGWRTATLYDLQDKNVMSAVHAAICTLHRGEALSVRFDVFSEIENLAEMLRKAGGDTPADMWWMSDLVAEIGVAIGHAGFDLVPSRNDGVSSNIMIGPEGQVILLDYDRAAMNDPLYDIAVLLTEACAFPSEFENWLEQWRGRADRHIVNRCILYGCADDLMWGLWSALCDISSPRRYLEFRKYAEWRYLRCRTTLGDPQFEERLRNI